MDKTIKKLLKARAIILGIRAEDISTLIHKDRIIEAIEAALKE